MARKYELKRRAERQQETRRHIVEAAIELHKTKGPARTTFTDVAREAGVQRHTLYRYFPDELALGAACSGLYLQTHPAPDPSGWRKIQDREQRLRHGLERLYTWYEEVEDMLTCILRDAEIHPPTGEFFERRARPALAAIRSALSYGLPRNKRAQALLDLALDFHAWRRLRASNLSPKEAATAMTRALVNE